MDKNEGWKWTGGNVFVVVVYECGCRLSILGSVLTIFFVFLSSLSSLLCISISSFFQKKFLSLLLLQKKGLVGKREKEREEREAGETRWWWW